MIDDRLHGQPRLIIFSLPRPPLESVTTVPMFLRMMKMETVYEAAAHLLMLSWGK